MDAYFSQIFSAPPKKIIENDYFYDADQEGDQFDENDEDFWLNQDGFKNNWERAGNWRTEITDLYGDATDKIAADNKPFMDIACGPGMGLAPAILQKNPKISCLATDACSRLIRAWRHYINRNLTQYNINLAAFSVLNIPIKDNSLDYVTSMIGISSTRNGEGGQIQALNEIFRVLKPNGYFVAVENEWTDYDKIDEVFKLWGKYNYYEEQKRMSPWHDKFISAGFCIESEDKHYFRKLRKDDNDLGEAADRFNIEIGMKFTLYVAKKM
ncbi:MAG: class I SAM-dependent methyltransferase [Oscillospiraceae bacterium]|nr:class I SAM-dependent methyltransferase [Oscillospiraceae bacterium]